MEEYLEPAIENCHNKVVYSKNMEEDTQVHFKADIQENYILIKFLNNKYPTF